MRPQIRHSSRGASLAVVAAVLLPGCSEERQEPRATSAEGAPQASAPTPTVPAAPVAAAPAGNAVEQGRALFKKFGCAPCHSIDGKKGIGPTLKGQFGTERKLVNGTTAVMDAAYVRATLEDPKRAVVDGYAPVMPPYKGRLTDAEVDALVAYVESLR
jgi:cytochrome c oxidase subunit 2